MEPSSTPDRIGHDGEGLSSFNTANGSPPPHTISLGETEQGDTMYFSGIVSRPTAEELAEIEYDPQVPPPLPPRPPSVRISKEPTEEEVELLRRTIRNKDTNEVFDSVDEISLRDRNYDLLPPPLVGSASIGVGIDPSQRRSGERGAGKRGWRLRGAKLRKDPSIKNTGTVKVLVEGKGASEFADLCLIQELSPHEGAVKALEWSPGEGEYLATGGEDGIIYVYRRLGSEMPSSPTQAFGGISGDAVLSASLTPTSAAASGLRPVSFTRKHRSCTSEPPTLNATPGAGGSGSSSTNASSMSGSEEGGWGLLDPTPVRIYTGHTAPITALSWSKSKFLLSASADCSARLWHVSVPTAVYEFQHPKPVTSVHFHPTREMFCVTGCRDGRVRVWDIRIQRVVKFKEMTEEVTSVRFNSNGRLVLAGSKKGQVTFYNNSDNLVDTLGYYTQIECRNRQGAFKGGRSVTGLAFKPRKDANITPDVAATATLSATVQPTIANSGILGRPEEVLVTTADSRLRLYVTETFAMRAKYKGHKAQTDDDGSSNLGARFSEDGRFIICGSEDGRVCIWPGSSPAASDTLPACATFSVTSSPTCGVTAAGFVPAAALSPPNASVQETAMSQLEGSGEKDVDYGSGCIVAADALGVIRVFALKSLLVM